MVDLTYKSILILALLVSDLYCFTLHCQKYSWVTNNYTFSLIKKKCLHAAWLNSTWLLLLKCITHRITVLASIVWSVNIYQVLMNDFSVCMKEFKDTPLLLMNSILPEFFSVVAYKKAKNMGFCYEVSTSTAISTSTFDIVGKHHEKRKHYGLFVGRFNLYCHITNICLDILGWHHKICGITFRAISIWSFYI